MSSSELDSFSLLPRREKKSVFLSKWKDRLRAFEAASPFLNMGSVSGF